MSLKQRLEDMVQPYYYAPVSISPDDARKVLALLAAAKRRRHTDPFPLGNIAAANEELDRAIAAMEE